MLSRLFQPSSPSKEPPTLKEFEHKMEHGTRLADAQVALSNYRVDGLVNSGGFAKVFACSQRRSKKMVVAKISPITHSSHEFKTEVAVLCTLRHKNIVHFQEAFVGTRNLWIILERMDGDLRGLGGCGRWGEAYLACAMKQALSALAYMHEHHLVHCDIKLDNILWDCKGNIKLADFGLCGGITQDFPKITQGKGTHGYRAPEVIDHFPYDAKADVWSLGVCVMELSQGYSQRWDEYDGAMLPTSAPYPNFPPAKSCSRRLYSFAVAMLQKDADKRYSAGELLKHTFITTKACTRSQLKPYMLDLHQQARFRVGEEEHGEHGEED